MHTVLENQELTAEALMDLLHAEKAGKVSEAETIQRVAWIQRQPSLYSWP